MRQVIVGNYYMGPESVQLVLREGFGGDFYPTPERGNIPRIKLGADQANWQALFNNLCHEAFEASLLRINCRFFAENNRANATDDCMFIANHQQLGETCARAGEFINTCKGDLNKAWNKWRKENRLNGKK
jgi:hypothetical protein